MGTSNQYLKSRSFPADSFPDNNFGIVILEDSQQTDEAGVVACLSRKVETIVWVSGKGKSNRPGYGLQSLDTERFDMFSSCDQRQ